MSGLGSPWGSRYTGTGESATGIGGARRPLRSADPTPSATVGRGREAEGSGAELELVALLHLREWRGDGEGEDEEGEATAAEAERVRAGKKESRGQVMEAIAARRAR